MEASLILNDFKSRILILANENVIQRNIPNQELALAGRAMTDHREDMMMEVEALESIYMQDFTMIKDKPLCYAVHIVPNQDGSENHVALTLTCCIPETYPEQEPNLEITTLKGLSDAQRNEIEALLQQQIRGNAGMPMIYTISEAVREYLVENNRAGHDGSEYQEMLRRMEIKKKSEDRGTAVELAKREEEAAHVQAKDTTGNPVTPKTFQAWRDQFDVEMRLNSKVAVRETNTKLTGRQLWTQGLVKDEGEEGIEDDFHGDSDDAEDAESDEDDVSEEEGKE
uniref:Uncharacterized protein AlNc14C21G2192 n=1 Tax=Albugo laibachii Nc14 TaxID=890382 RepID=F0W5M7_9STRA|nr:conserved hypothetical protein [Albugo laibachii Nc14]|eukprot:CCA16418.1 conserved hypothetical protein [Albugo laibachii Nc14]